VDSKLSVQVQTRLATALPAIRFPLLTTRVFCSPKKTRESCRQPRLQNPSYVPFAGFWERLLKKNNNSRAMQHFLALCNQSKKIRQAQDRAFGTTTALRTAEVWELWKLWSHQRRCASPTTLWSLQWCRCPLSLLSPQE